MIKFINGYLFINNELVKKDFSIINKKITFKDIQNIKIYDLKGLVVLPGFIDIHIHTRNPGYEKKETIKNINSSLLYGGFTHAIAQSNIKPLPVNIETFNNAQKILNKLTSNVIQAGRITNNNKVISDENYWKKISYATDDGDPVNDKLEMKKALQLAKKHNVKLLLHEQDSNIKGHCYQSDFAKKYDLIGFDDSYEANCLKRDIDLNTKINANIHIQHISTIKSLDLYKKAKINNMNITAELTPHHLLLDSSMIPGDDGNYKMNPPLADSKTKKQFLKAFKNGEINIISTDHAPHTNLEKTGGFKKSLNGIIGLETSFALINTLLHQEKIPLKFLVNALSINPGQIMGIDNEIYEGNIANLTIVDLNRKWVFTIEDIKSKAINSPFVGTKLIGKVEKIIVNGVLKEL